ncbi:MAG TPA: glycosyltransferase family 39 protein [Gemmatimonadaceae bacterium]|jgi:hypothetical protein|nr:glycosyltransferase family 39 protein [Gemmatimonadaceae bacterium]
MTTRVRVTPALVIAVATLIRLVLAANVPLFPDETYYWEWSRHLAAGYFDHPPAIALLIRAGTVLLGDTNLGVRLGAILAGIVTSWALVTLARRLEERTSGDTLSDPSAIRVAILAACIPVAFAGFVLATPDAPLLAILAVMLVALDRAFAAPYQSWDALQWWCAAGVMLGVGLCTKYTAVLVPFAVCCAMLVRPGLRIRFREPGPYVATIIAVLIFMPVILWNAQHQWVSFAFQIRHGLGHTTGSALIREVQLIGGQLGLISPILAVMGGIMVAKTLRRSSSDRRFAIAAIAMTITLFFLVSALRKPVEANWPAPVLLATLPLLATWNMRGITRRWFQWGVGLAMLCTVALATHALVGFFPVPHRRDPMTQAYGWDHLAAQVERVHDTLASRTSCTHTWITADRYQDASELAFHLAGHPPVFALNMSGRANQYDLWPTLWTTARHEDCLVLVVDDDRSGMIIVQRVAIYRSRPEDAGLAPLLLDGQPIARRHLWVVRNENAVSALFHPNDREP